MAHIQVKISKVQVEARGLLGSRDINVFRLPAMFVGLSRSLKMSVLSLMDAQHHAQHRAILTSLSQAVGLPTASLPRLLKLSWGVWSLVGCVGAILVPHTSPKELPETKEMHYATACTVAFDWNLVKFGDILAREAVEENCVNEVWESSSKLHH